MTDQGGRDHWLCPGCDTFDGPISYRRCDVCDDRPEVRAMVPASECDRLRAENERLREALGDQVEAAEFCIDSIERHGPGEGDPNAFYKLLRNKAQAALASDEGQAS